MPPNSRISFNVAEYVKSYNVSTLIDVTTGVLVCERAMYGNNRLWAHDSIGVKSYHRSSSLGPVGSTIWCLAEGCTAGGTETWILVENPYNSSVNINMVFQTDMGIIQGPQEKIPANSRKSYNVGAYVTSYNVSTKITSNSTIVCERAMYGNNRNWGTNSIGFDAVYGEIE